MARVLPAKLPERGLGKDIQRTVNKLIEYVREIQPVAGVGQRLTRTPNGTVVRGESSKSVVAQESSWFY